MSILNDLWETMPKPQFHRFGSEEAITEFCIGLLCVSSILSVLVGPLLWLTFFPHSIVVAFLIAIIGPGLSGFICVWLETFLKLRLRRRYESLD